MLVQYEIALLFITALTVGTIGNLVGIGGGVLIMIVLLFVFKMNPVIAAGFSLATIIISSTAGSASNLRQKAISRKLFYIIALFAGAGMVCGSVTSYFVSTKPFDFVFGFVSISIGVFSVVATRRDVAKRVQDGTTEESFVTLSASEKRKLRESVSGWKSIGAISAVAGFVAGLFGIGIGGIMGTYLTAIRRINPKLAFSSILAAMIVTSLIGAFLHFAAAPAIGEELLLVAVLAAGAATGAIAGSYLSGKVKSLKLRFMQGYIIISLGIITLLLTLASFS